MKRIAMIHIDDTDCHGICSIVWRQEADVEHLRAIDPGRYSGMHVTPAPPDDQLTRDLNLVTEVADDLLADRWPEEEAEQRRAEVHAAAVRLRAAAGLDDE